MELIPRTCTTILAAHLSLWRCMSLLFLFTLLPHLLKFLVFSPCYIAMAQNQDIRRPLLRSLASLDSVHHLSQALHHPGCFLLFLVFLELALGSSRFLWWSVGHLTPLGQALAKEKLSRGTLSLLGC